MGFTCVIARRHVVAWNDGELCGLTLRFVRSHYASCAKCRAVAEAWAEEQRQQALVLGALLRLADIPTDRHWTSLEQRLGQQDSIRVHRGIGLLPSAVWRRPLVAAAASAIMLLASWKLARIPEGVAIALGIKSPPPEVLRMPELFQDFALVEKLDVLEQLDALGGNESADPQSQPNG